MKQTYTYKTEILICILLVSLLGLNFFFSIIVNALSLTLWNIVTMLIPTGLLLRFLYLRDMKKKVRNLNYAVTCHSIHVTRHVTRYRYYYILRGEFEAEDNTTFKVKSPALKTKPQIQDTDELIAYINPLNPKQYALEFRQEEVTLYL